MLWEVDISPRPGLPNRAAEAVCAAAADLGLGPLQLTAAQGYLIQADLERGQVERIAEGLLCDGVVEQVIVGPLTFERLQFGQPYQFELRHVAIRELTDAELARLSREGQLYLQLAEMRAIQAYYREL